MRDNIILMMRPDVVRDRVAARLRQQSLDANVADGFVQGLELLLAETPDVAVLDMALDGVEGADTCARLGRRTDAGLIAISDDDGRPSAAETLDAGAHDYLARPFGAIELVARVRALLRRLKEYSVAARMCLQCGDLLIDARKHEVTLAGEPVDLTPKEFDLLMALAARPGELVRREDLLSDIWGLGDGLSSRTLDVHIGRLRRKIETSADKPTLILTVPRVGYKLAA